MGPKQGQKDSSCSSGVAFSETDISRCGQTKPYQEVQAKYTEWPRVFSWPGLEKWAKEGRGSAFRMGPKCYLTVLIHTFIEGCNADGCQVPVLTGLPATGILWSGHRARGRHTDAPALEKL